MDRKNDIVVANLAARKYGINVVGYGRFIGSTALNTKYRILLSLFFCAKSVAASQYCPRSVPMVSATTGGVASTVLLTSSTVGMSATKTSRASTKLSE